MSAKNPFHGNPLAPNPDGQQRPRQVESAQLFWVNMSVPFASVAGEQKQGFSKVEDYDLFVRGAWSNLAQARVRFVSEESGLNWATIPGLLLSQVGNSDKVQPIAYWHTPVLLRAKNQIRGDFVNDGGEAAGRVVLFTDVVGSAMQIGIRRSQIFSLTLDLGLDAAVALNSTSTSTIDEPLLIWGATTNATNDLLVQLSDERTNYAWSSEQLPVGAFAGLIGEVQPRLYYRKPYFLPGRVKLRVSYNNAGMETGKFITFFCERLFEYQ